MIYKPDAHYPDGPMTLTINEIERITQPSRHAFLEAAKWYTRTRWLMFWAAVSCLGLSIVNIVQMIHRGWGCT